MTRMNTRVFSACLLLAGAAQAQSLSFGAKAKADSKEGASADASADADAPEQGAADEKANAKPEAKAEAKADKPIGPEMPYMQRYKREANMWELGLFGGIMLPSGSHELYEFSDTQQGFKAAGEIGLRVGYYPVSFLGAEIEGAALPSEAKDGTSAGLWAGRAHLIAQLPDSSVSPFLLVGGGFLGAGSDAMGSDIDPTLNVGLGIKAALDEHVGFRLDLRDNMSQKHDADQGALTHHPEALIGITFVPGRKNPDYDGDGVNDFRDACPRVSGEHKGCPAPDADKDGVPDETDACPEVASSHESGCPDDDGDGLEDSKDACPMESGPAPTGCPEKECKVKDTDGDGRTDEADACPNEAADTADGCPTKDQDGDGIPDDKDKCVDKPETKNGFRDRDGCPDEVPEAVKKFDGVMDGISFEFGSSKITAQSKPQLEETMKIMKEYPSLHVEISGHTDATGDAKRNEELSLARADAVKKFLTEGGIEADRIETKGYGPEKPIADNKTEAGRKKNRRIEFHLVHDKTK